VPPVAAPGTFVVSLDFELFWGVRDQPHIERYGANLHGSRQVVPRLLERFAASGVRATWATVGMLFCESKEELIERLPAERPHYSDPELSPYEHVRGIGNDERSDPLHFAPSLVREIRATDGQELATHTFSHYYCLEGGQTAAQFEADLRAAIDVARDRGVELQSIVFPRNQVNPAYLPLCAEHGLTAYRGTQQRRMHSPRAGARDTLIRRAARLLDSYAPLPPGRATGARPAVAGGLVDVPASRFFRPRTRGLGALEPLKVRRVTGELEAAARTGADYHLWWHPHNFGVDQDAHLAQLDAVLRTFERLRDEGTMRSLTMAELAAERAL
jgi:peptidoglycan/xylan/chitin deacetylase (PgdA/CDA1 family)